jgi:hypothetical protein
MNVITSRVVTRVLLIALGPVVACGTQPTAKAYGTCTAADTCPSDTVCESSSPTSPTFCTHSCAASTNLDPPQPCPTDPLGQLGVCVVNEPYGFCFQACGPVTGDAGAGACPANETCATIPPSVAVVGGLNICVPGLAADPLNATSWQSTTLTTTATNAGVTASTYTMTFASGTIAYDGSGATGAFTAKFTQTYGPSAPQYAGCLETTSFVGGTWSDSSTPLIVKVTSAIGATSRTGCSKSSDDATNLVNVYDDYVDAYDGTAFTVSGNTLTFTTSTGVTPYTGDTWTFTRM